MKIIKNIYFYLIVLFSGWSTLFFRSNEGLVVIFVIGLFIFGKSLIRPTRMLLIALSVWMGYFIVNTIMIKSFHPFFMATYIINIIIAWWFVSYYKEKLFLKYENAIYFLSIISLVFYSWQVIHFNSLYNLITVLDLSNNLFPNVGYASILIYSIRDWDPFLLFPRNQGFTWEPGPFSSYVALALFFNLARNNMMLKDYLRLSVFLLAIITTQSTTGIIMLFAISVWLAWNHGRNIYMRFISISLITIVLLYIFIHIPLLQEKIILESQQNVEALIDNSLRYGSSYNPSRIASFQIAWRDFKNYPFSGIGGDTLRQYTIKQGAEVNTINGLGMIMTRYGSIGLVLFFILIGRTGKWLSEFNTFDGYFIFPALILIISFSFGIIETPLIVTLWMSSIFLKKPIFYYYKLCLEKFSFS